VRGVLSLASGPDRGDTSERDAILNVKCEKVHENIFLHLESKAEPFFFFLEKLIDLSHKWKLSVCVLGG
jgi:hypothetical protein